MAEIKPKIPPQVGASLLGSGFPFQTAIANAVRQVPGCAIVAEEWPWGTEEFADLVVQKAPIVACVECKKTREETFTFLQANGAHEGVLSGRYLVRGLPVEPRGSSSGPGYRLYYAECSFIDPASREATFCVASGHSGNKRLLEPDARLIVGATDAYGLFVQRTAPDDGQIQCLIPVIVTNAQLFVAEYDPSAVSLETGEISPADATITPVEWIRFRKAFTSPRFDIGDRTVWVVSALAVQRFFELLLPSWRNVITDHVWVSN